MRLSHTLALVTGLMAALPTMGQSINLPPGVRVHLRPVAYQTPVGQPVRVLFAVENTTDDPITIVVPGVEPQIPSPEAGLPLSHVFSGGEASGVSVTTSSGRRWEKPTGFRAHKEAPILMVAPRSTVGTTLDVREFFPALRGAGKYRLEWRPYGGQAGSDSAFLTVAALKQAEIITDDGIMTVRFYYDGASATVANFIELIESGFYNGKTFHRLEPGFLLQGGCPRGDGTGIRLDGRRLLPEFNSMPHQKGSLSMALLADEVDSASCQFFICNTRQKEWDGRYTVFGQLVGDESFATLERLMGTAIDEHARPLRTLTMRTVRVIDGPTDYTIDPPPDYPIDSQIPSP